MAYRVQHRFWLDLDNPDEASLNDLTVQLRKKRAFTATIRDGIRLICDLRRGSLDVLFELFPWVRAEFLDYMQACLRRQALQPDTAAAEQRLEQQLARLEQLLLQQASAPAGPRLIEALGPLALPKAVGPVSDEDDAALVTVTKAKVDGAHIAQNFIRSMMALQQ